MGPVLIGAFFNFARLGPARLGPVLNGAKMLQNVHPKVQEKSAKNGTFFSEKNGEKL